LKSCRRSDVCRRCDHEYLGAAKGLSIFSTVDR